MTKNFMTLKAGDRLGPYQVVGLLGAGGMGEVYTARDTRLDRTVAIKTLPVSLAADPQFRDRFDREARVLSGLDHPHICPVYDVGEHGGTSFIVMPLLDGESLAARLDRGALPLADALTVAAQVADALARAHRAGIVHRDLKPANVMLTKSGATLLDFGLAKGRVEVVTGPSGSAATVQNLTAQGSILGTLQYMSPEQLEGHDADERTDVFALGAVLYEMVTGRKAFSASSHASLIAAILERDPPPVSNVQPVAPAALDRIVGKCLAKNPDARWQSAADLADELRWIAAASDAATGTSSRGPTGSHPIPWAWVVGVAAVVALVATVALAVKGRFAPAMPEPPAFVSAFVLPRDLRFLYPGPTIGRFAVSPDGRAIAFQAADNRSGTSRVWLRRFDSLDASPIPGTEGAVAVFWSPDSRSIAFSTTGDLKRVDVAGGAPVTIANGVVSLFPGAWGRNGVILFDREQGGPLYRVSASGGPIAPATRIDAGAGERAHVGPSFLSDGRHFIFTAVGSDRASRIMVASLDGGPTKVILDGIPNAAFAEGRLLYLHGSTLIAQTLDERNLEVTGEPSAVADNLEIGVARTGTFHVSAAGVLAYLQNAQSPQSQLRLVDRTGALVSNVGEPADQLAPSLSPDGNSAAVSLLDPSRGTRDLWIYDLTRNNIRVRFTSDPGDEIHAVWSPDGTSVIYDATHGELLDIYRRSASGVGAPELLLSGLGTNKYPTSWSPDGSTLLFFNGSSGARGTGVDLWALPLRPKGTPVAVVQTDFSESGGRFSPDGRWIAYQSNEAGKNDIYVIPVHGSSGKTLVSPGGGVEPRWRRDGKELFYQSPDGKLMAVAVDGTSATFHVGAGRALFDAPAASRGYEGLYPGASYDAAPDGQRFLLNTPAGPGRERATIMIVTNWVSMLSRH